MAKQLDKAMIHTWRQAAVKLGIRIIAPFAIHAEGEEIWYEAYIADFGGPNGTVVSSHPASKPGTRQQQNYYASTLWPVYRIYSRELFIDTLNDWQWFGAPGQQPSWYTGKP